MSAYGVGTSTDTDMAGIVHFSNFFRYMERVEHAFFRSLGFSIVDKPVEGEERVGCDAIALAATVSPSFELAIRNTTSGPRSTARRAGPRLAPAKRTQMMMSRLMCSEGAWL